MRNIKPVRTAKDFERAIGKNPDLKKLALEYVSEKDPELNACYLNMQRYLFEALSECPSDQLNTDAIIFADDYQELGQEIITLYASKMHDDYVNDMAEREHARQVGIKDAMYADNIQEI